MDPNSSVRKTYLGENVIEVLSEKAKGHGDWNFVEYQDTANSGGKKEMMEDDVEPRVVLGRSFMRVTKGIANFKKGIITIYLELDPFLDSFGETRKTDDNWDLWLDDLDFGDVSDIKGVKVLPSTHFFWSLNHHGVK
nr:hypothetical protein [Tanacetum cinerariifolium]